MTFDDIVKAVSDRCPDFNKSAMTGFIERHINNSPSFPQLVMEEGFKLAPPSCDLQMQEVRILSPEERVHFELRPTVNKATRPRVPLTVTHMRLVEYRVRFEKEIISTKLYAPYMFDNMLFMNDKRTMIRKIILEQTFSRMQDKDKDGVLVSPIRVNLKFNRRKTFTIYSYLDRMISYRRFIITAGLFHGKQASKICETTIIHYMLAKFGFLRTLHRFGLSEQDISFVTEIGQDTDLFEYFAARQFNSGDSSGPGLFLKVNRGILLDDQAAKFVVNLMYVLHFFDLQDIDNVYLDDGYIFKVMLGMIIFGRSAIPKALTNAETNLRSVDYFIDPITKRRFNNFGVHIEDTYDLLVYLFKNIDAYMVNTKSQDIYQSRIDVTNGILVEAYAHKIVGNLYYLAKRTNITPTDVKKALRFNAMMFRMGSSARKDDAEHYMAPPEIIGDNLLFSGALAKIRLGGRPDQRLHPSMLVAESICAFVGKTNGKTGVINPYIPTDDETGAILHPDYAEEIDRIINYLPR